MKNIVNIKNTDIKVGKSKNINIGSIDNGVEEKNSADSSDNVTDVIKKTGRIDKVIVIVFVVAIIALVVVLKNI